MKDVSNPPPKNRILNSISAGAMDRLRPSLETFPMELGKVILRPDQPIDYLYFPENSMISVVVRSEEGQAAEVAVIGNEGAAGTGALLGARNSPHENIVQLGDGGSRIKTDEIRAEFERRGSLYRSVLSFTHKYMVQVAQTAFCNRFHRHDQRLSRWLLMYADRCVADTLPLTHEFLAVMLGANRTTVTTTAIELQNQGLISYFRGMIKITNRAGLESSACACYSIIKNTYSATPPAPAFQIPDPRQQTKS